jgi:uncharacterized circularly permuted ATP-grasp superfamily protein
LREEKANVTQGLAQIESLEKAAKAKDEAMAAAETVRVVFRGYFSNSHLSPRHFDLRAYYCTGNEGDHGCM